MMEIGFFGIVFAVVLGILLADWLKEEKK